MGIFDFVNTLFGTNDTPADSSKEANNTIDPAVTGMNAINNLFAQAKTARLDTLGVNYDPITGAYKSNPAGIAAALSGPTIGPDAAVNQSAANAASAKNNATQTDAQTKPASEQSSVQKLIDQFKQSPEVKQIQDIIDLFTGSSGGKKS